MIPYLYLREAKLRLININETIKLMGGEDECQPMLLGQRDMLELEVEYYQQKSKKFTTRLLITVSICVTLLLYYRYGVLID
jgi:hypothetical protein